MATSDGLKKDTSVIKKPGNAKFCSLRFVLGFSSEAETENQSEPLPYPTESWEERSVALSLHESQFLVVISGCRQQQ